MSDSQSFDVIVVGGGPGGSIAAKCCAESGLTTLLIEKKKLPRDKVCTGMVMGDWARNIIRQNFGEIPETVLVDPWYLSGHRFYVAGEETQALEWPTPLAWRKDLDFWMIRRAEEAGVTMRQGSGVISVKAEQGICVVTTQRERVVEKFRARYVVGADGSTSVVRRSLAPNLKVRYSGPDPRMLPRSIGT